MGADGSLVTVEQCRALYSDCDGVLTTYQTNDGAVPYDNYCPCYDANGSNTGINIVPREVFTQNTNTATTTAVETTTTNAPTFNPTADPTTTTTQATTATVTLTDLGVY